MAETKKKELEIIKFGALSRLKNHAGFTADEKNKEILEEIQILQNLFPDNFDISDDREEYVPPHFDDSKLSSSYRRKIVENLKSWATLAIYIDLSSGEPFVIPAPREPKK